jgi:hypothetical protein
MGTVRDRGDGLRLPHTSDVGEPWKAKNIGEEKERRQTDRQTDRHTDGWTQRDSHKRRCGVATIHPAET